MPDEECWLGAAASSSVVSGEDQGTMVGALEYLFSVQNQGVNEFTVKVAVPPVTKTP